MFSQRTKIAQENEYSLALRSSRIDIDLSLSNPTKAGFSTLGEDELQGLLVGCLGQVYEGNAFGGEGVREKINDMFYYGVGGVDDLCLTASTSEAYGLLFKLLCEAGDEVLVPEPSYPLFEALAGLDCVRLVSYPLYYDGDDWYIDFHALEGKIGLRTRAMIIVNPNNPTGHYVKQEEFDRLVSLGLPLIVDEVFRGFDLEEVAPVVFEDGVSPIFVLNGLSKSLGYPFLKLGWIKVLGEKAWKREALDRLSWASDAYLSVNGLSSQMIEYGLLEKSQQRRDEISLRIKENHGILNQLLSEQNCISTYQGRAGWMRVLSLPSIYEDEAWCLILLKHGILVQPGYFYDFHKSNLVVISLLPLTQDFSNGVKRLIEVVLQEMEQHCE
jgi:alanine-synthesizing transaminase